MAKPGPRKTGERFMLADAERAEKVIELMALGHKDGTIARRMHSDPLTIKQVRLRHSEDVAKRKAEILALVLPGAAIAARKTIELLAKEKQSRNAAVTHGIFVDSIQKLTGGVTQRIEISGNIDIHARYDELARKLAASPDVIEAEVIDPPNISIENGTD